MASYTKGQGEIHDWQALADTVTDAPSGESNEISKATELEVKIVVTVGHVDANDAAANFITGYLEAKLGAAAGGEDWKKILEFQAGGGQAVTEALNAASASGQAEIQVAATTDWDTGLGERLLLYNVGAILTSEVVEIDFWDDADHYTAMDNLSNSHDAGDGDALYDLLDEIVITIPAGVVTARVTMHNSDDDANYLWRVDYFEVQSIA